MFYKLKTLADAGVSITLHAFDYGRGRAPLLDKICEKVHYYPRRMHPLLFMHKLPFIVVSRMQDSVLKNLSADAHPVLFEGIHTCGYLGHPALSHKTRVVRSHNIEHEYYHSLSQAEQRLFRRSYMRREAIKLRQFEPVYRHAHHVAAISMHDQQHFLQQGYPSSLVSAFHPHESVSISPGTGNFALYHGNLGVAENDKAACYLIEEVFAGTDVPLVVAGNNPGKRLRQLASGHPNVQLKFGVTTSYIHELIREAHINVLPTFQPTGIKLKLLAALYNGRHCLVNAPMVKDTGLEHFCTQADTAAHMRSSMLHLMKVPFGEKEIERRKELQEGRFSNAHNAEKLLQLLFS